MAKGQQKGNREKRKPKADKPKPSAGATSPFASPPGMNKGGGSKKSR